MITAALAMAGLTACKPAGGVTADSNLDCAALISAATVLVRRGKAENDTALMKRALVSSMTHLNAYAIPKGMTEAEAFEELKSVRENFLENRSADEIMRRGKLCTDRTPAS